jgi:hypothetical protein
LDLLLDAGVHIVMQNDQFISNIALYGAAMELISGYYQIYGVNFTVENPNKIIFRIIGPT